MPTPDYVNRNQQGYDIEARLVAPAAITADGQEAGVEVGENVDLEVKMQVRGAVTGTSPTLDIKLQESDDDSTYTDIPGGAFSQATATGVDERITVKTTKKYVRADKVVGGTTPSFGDTEVFIAS